MNLPSSLTSACVFAHDPVVVTDQAVAVPDQGARYDARGVPRWGRDFGADTLPQEAGLKHAVSFDKGCYLGQEPVVMLEHRGKPPKRLVRLELEDAVEVGAPVEAAERQVGRVTSAAGTRALALVKRKALEGEAPLEVGGRALTRWALVEGDATVARAGGEP